MDSRGRRTVRPPPNNLMETSDPKKGPAKKAKKNTATEDAITTVVVGLDFGTTYSGVAFARSTKPETIKVVTDWGGHHYYAAQDKEKAPSVISYDDQGQFESWGYGFSPPSEPIRWFKLLLIDEEDIPEELRNTDEFIQAKMLLKKHNKQPVEVVGDYLRQLWNHACDQMESALSHQVLEGCHLKIVATLPAIWPPYAQVRMREAIELAGILDKKPRGEPNLTFISEPEAAALASISDSVEKIDVKNGNHFVVCDAGGGTVDLISYEISSTEPMVVKESVCGDGALCGAILLDKGFNAMFRSMVSRQTWDSMDSTILHRITISEWENSMKRSFNGSTHLYQVYLPFGGIVGKPSILRVQAAQLDHFYSPVAVAVEILVRKQIDAVLMTSGRRPKAVILVGGFGKSPFLRKHLKEKFPLTQIKRDTGERPWTAVCRGAVIKGLHDSGVSGAFDIDIQSRVSRVNYGTVFNGHPFEAGVDDPRDRLWCDVQQEFLAVDQIEWFLRMDTPIEQATVVRSYWQDFPAPEESIVIDFVKSEQFDPPGRCDETVKDGCRIEFKLPAFETLPEWHNNEGKSIRRITYDLKMTIIGLSLDFAIYYKGRRMGSQNVKVTFEERVATQNDNVLPSVETQPTIDNNSPMEDQPTMDDCSTDETLSITMGPLSDKDSDYAP